MIIRDIMCTNIETASPATRMHEVAQKMRKSDNGYVFISENDRLVGVITDRDIALRCVAEGHVPAETEARKVMTPEVLYCQETDVVDDVAKNMSENKIRHLVVMNADKRMVGIVSLGDLAIVKKARSMN